jgi:formylglycine-generating enzyme required for sulfatase activity
VNLFKSAVVWLVVVAICGCDQEQRKTLRPTPPGPSKQEMLEMLTPDPTPVATPVEDMELPESAESIGMEFKLIPAGTFTMGDASGDDDETPHEVTLTQPFKMGVHEVTQAQYEQVMGVNPSTFKGANNPVEMVSWEDAVEFCRRLSELPAEKAAGNVYRLPTEAEWEYACRAGTTTKYSFGDDDSGLGDYAWHSENSDKKPHPVGSKLPNAWGLYDMHGNVSEWCQDWYVDYPSGSVTDPRGATSGSYRVLRGGSWPYTAGDCRSAGRNGFFLPSDRSSFLGFRVVRSSGK